MLYFETTSHHILVPFSNSSDFNTFRHDLNSLTPCQNQNFPISFILEFINTCIYFSEFGICLQKHCQKAGLLKVSCSHTRVPKISLGELSKFHGDDIVHNITFISSKNHFNSCLVYYVHRLLTGTVLDFVFCPSVRRGCIRTEENTAIQF